MTKFRIRRVVGVLVLALFGWYVATADLNAPEPATPPVTEEQKKDAQKRDADALSQLEKLEVKGRAPKTGYSRDQFGDGWRDLLGCDMRNTILYRDLTDTTVADDCSVQKGTLHDPYTGKVIQFERGEKTSALVQIDHVVALSDAWQKGAQQLSEQRRIEFANDPLNLLAVDGAANQEKSDSDAASWLPAQKAFRCQYVGRQIAVKEKYDLWITQAEKEAMIRVLSACTEAAV